MTRQQPVSSHRRFCFHFSLPFFCESTGKSCFCLSSLARGCREDGHRAPQPRCWALPWLLAAASCPGEPRPWGVLWVPEARVGSGGTHRRSLPGALLPLGLPHNPPPLPRLSAVPSAPPALPPLPAPARLCWEVSRDPEKRALGASRVAEPREFVSQAVSDGIRNKSLLDNSALGLPIDFLPSDPQLSPPRPGSAGLFSCLVC